MELLEEVLQFIKEMDAETDFEGNETYLHRRVREAIEAEAKDEKDFEQLKRRHNLVLRLRTLAAMACGLKVALPTLPVEKWLDGTITDATKDVYFAEYDLSALLQFIADVGVSYED